MIELNHAISTKSQKISEYYGEKQELEKLIEECAEVIQAAQKYKEHRTVETLDNLCEEIADTLAVAERCLFLMDVDPDEIQGIIDAKTDRQIERMQKAGGAKDGYNTNPPEQHHTGESTAYP